MSYSGTGVTHERRQSVWLLTVSPLIWAGHFLLSYLTAAIWIEKEAGRDHTLDPVRFAIAIYTVVACAGIVVVLWKAWRKHRFGSAEVPHDEDTPEDRHRFLGFSTVLLSLLSLVATLFVAMAILFIETTN